MSKLTGSKKATQFTESVIREMTRLNHQYGGVNLSQGFPDFPAPAAIKEAFPDIVPEVPRAFERSVQGRLPLLRIGWAVIRPAPPQDAPAPAAVPDPKP